MNRGGVELLGLTSDGMHLTRKSKSQQVKSASKFYNLSLTSVV